MLKNRFVRHVVAAGMAAAISSFAFAADITGAGATFPYPIYAKWAEAYKAKANVGMNYQSIGSGGGIKQITAKTVDFGASDKPLEPKELDAAGLMQFPAIMGGVVPVINLAGFAPGEIKLTPEVLADIFLGKIKKWNDPALLALNPKLKTMDENITVVRRADGSGTTFIFTNYLSKVSKEWSDKVGASTAVAWPEGVGGKGNEGVASYVQRIKGSIGYVEYAYAKKTKMAHVQLKNRDGEFVQPSEKSFQAAASQADWKNAPGFYEILTNEPGKTSWPITGASFILMHKVQDKPENAKEVLKFFDWSFKNGDDLAQQLDYVVMPDNVVKMIQDAWKANLRDAGGKAIW